MGQSPWSPVLHCHLPAKSRHTGLGGSALARGLGLVLEQPVPLHFQNSPSVVSVTGISSFPAVLLCIFCFTLAL